MARMMIKQSVSADRQLCVIELHKNGAPLGHIELDAASLEGLIHDLGKARASMIEEVSPSLDPGSRIEAVVNPSFLVPKDLEIGKRVLALRHPGLGWVAFLLTLDYSKEIGRLLSKKIVK